MKKISIPTLILGVFLFTSLTSLLPFTGNLVFHTKLYLLFGCGLAIAAYYVIHSLKQKSLQFIASPLTLPVALFGVSAFISSYFTMQYPTENFLDLGGAYIAVAVIGLMGALIFSKKQLSTFINIMTVGSVIVVIDSLLQLVGFGSAQLFGWMLNTEINNMVSFTLVGSARVAFQLMIVTLVGIVVTTLQHSKINKVHLASLLFVIIGLGLYGWAIMPGRASAAPSPSYQASWSIALDSLKTPRSALFGIGPANYKNAYSTFKPVWINGTSNWSVPFTQASNAPLTILTTLGFVGAVVWVWLVVVSFKELRNSSKKGKVALFMLLTTFILQLFFTFNLVILMIQALLLALYAATERERCNMFQFGKLRANIFKNQGNLHSFESSIPLYIATAVIAVGILYSGYQVSRSYWAFRVFYKANAATLDSEDNGVVRSYELHQAAIQLNPYLDTFHRSYASTNMVIARALSNKADITEAETQQVAQLLQQAVREARSATILDPNDSENWLVLGRIYQDMMAITEEAPQFAVDTYSRAIRTNPTNPILRILLGNVFAGVEDHQTAIAIYNQAIELKPDLAEAHFSIARSLIAIEQYLQAEVALNTTLSLIDQDTEEYATVQGLLDQITPMAEEQRAAIEAQQAQQAEQARQLQEAQAAEQGEAAGPQPEPPVVNPPIDETLPTDDAEVLDTNPNDITPDELPPVEEEPLSLPPVEEEPQNLPPAEEQPQEENLTPENDNPDQP